MKNQDVKRTVRENGSFSIPMQINLMYMASMQYDESV